MVNILKTSLLLRVPTPNPSSHLHDGSQDRKRINIYPEILCRSSTTDCSLAFPDTFVPLLVADQGDLKNDFLLALQVLKARAVIAQESYVSTKDIGNTDLC